VLLPKHSKSGRTEIQLEDSEGKKSFVIAAGTESRQKSDALDGSFFTTVRRGTTGAGGKKN